jgi:hypothetical protein
MRPQLLSVRFGLASDEMEALKTRANGESGGQEQDREEKEKPESTGLEPATSAVTGRRSNQLS